MTCGEELRLEKVGGIPGMPRREVSLILLGERFVLGFGGMSALPLAELWVFDLRTRRASLVWETDEWVDGADDAPFFLRDGRLWVVRQKVTIIPLGLVAERIDDDEIRRAFCEALQLPPAPRYYLPPPKAVSSSGMVRVCARLPFMAYTVLHHRNRILCFSVNRGELLASEMIFYGQKVRLLTTGTGVRMNGRRLGCCSLGDRVLVMCGRLAGDANDGDVRDDRADRGEATRAGGDEEGALVSAALVAVDDGRLSEETVHATALTVSGDLCWQDPPFLCQVTESRALLYFGWERGMWYCDVTGTALSMRRLATRMPTDYGFFSLPICLPDGNLLVAGSHPSSRDITLVTCDEEPRFERIGNIPGEARWRASIVLVGERFVVGVGGHSTRSLGDLWIFDLRTGRGSQVRRRGDWPSRARGPFLAVRDGIVYLIRGESIHWVHCISLSALSGLIQSDRVRAAFSWHLGLPFKPRGCFTKEVISGYTAPCL